MNYFHWHLTDDHGWRIEIKKYPKLTETAAFRDGTLSGIFPAADTSISPRISHIENRDFPYRNQVMFSFLHCEKANSFRKVIIIPHVLGTSPPAYPVLLSTRSCTDLCIFQEHQ